MNGVMEVDPLAEGVAALVGEDFQYWTAHPELPALVSHFIAKGRTWCGRCDFRL